MEQSLRVYRRHTKACLHSYIKPIYDGDRGVQDCSCPLCIEGYLRKELDAKGKPKRIRHIPLKTTRWDEARTKRDQYLTWGSLIAPACPEDPSAFSGYINRILLNRENLESLFLRHHENSMTACEYNRGNFCATSGTDLRFRRSSWE